MNAQQQLQTAINMTKVTGLPCTECLKIVQQSETSCQCRNCQARDRQADNG